jgi:hypothetical protein
VISSIPCSRLSAGPRAFVGSCRAWSKQNLPVQMAGNARALDPVTALRLWISISIRRELQLPISRINSSPHMEEAADLPMEARPWASCSRGCRLVCTKVINSHWKRETRAPRYSVCVDADRYPRNSTAAEPIRSWLCAGHTNDDVHLSSIAEPIRDAFECDTTEELPAFW